MRAKQALQATAPSAQQAHGHRHRAYTVAQLCEVLILPRSTFMSLRKKGQLPFLEELKPRLGRVVRYRADLVDRYLAGQWEQPRAFRHARQSAVAQPLVSRP